MNLRKRLSDILFLISQKTGNLGWLVLTDEQAGNLANEMNIEMMNDAVDLFEDIPPKDEQH